MKKILIVIGLAGAGFICTLYHLYVVGPLFGLFALLLAISFAKNKKDDVTL